MIRCYFVVEGPHEIEVIGHFLKRRGLIRVRLLQNLDIKFRALVPTTYPAQDGDILRRVSAPTFFQSESHCVAIDSAIGVEKLCNTYRARLTRIPDLDAVGILADADQNATNRWQEIVTKLPDLKFGDKPGEVAGANPRAGIYILPDNKSLGTLENVLIECGEIVYPKLLDGAREFIGSIKATDTEIFKNSKESSDFSKPFGKNKAIVACVANVLRPGKAVQVSIQDNRWVSDSKVLESKILLKLPEFVDDILGIESEDLKGLT